MTIASEASGPAPKVWGHFINGPLDGQSLEVPGDQTVYAPVVPEPDPPIWRQLEFELPYSTARRVKTAVYERRIIADGWRRIYIYVLKGIQ